MWSRYRFLVACGFVLVVLCPCANPAWAGNWNVALQSGSAGEAQSNSLPPAPASPAAACTSLTSNTIKVTWSAVTHASTYSVYQSTGGANGPFSLVVSGITTTSWTTGSLASGNYWYEVSAVEGSSWASVNSASTPELTITLVLCEAG